MGCSHLVASTLSLRTARPATMCDIALLVEGRPNCARQRLASTVSVVGWGANSAEWIFEIFVCFFDLNCLSFNLRMSLVFPTFSLKLIFLAAF